MECVALVSLSNTVKRQADSDGPESAAILEKLKIDYKTTLLLSSNSRKKRRLKHHEIKGYLRRVSDHGSGKFSPLLERLCGARRPPTANHNRPINRAVREVRRSLSKNVGLQGFGGCRRRDARLFKSWLVPQRGDWPNGTAWEIGGPGRREDCLGHFILGSLTNEASAVAGCWSRGAADVARVAVIGSPYGWIRTAPK